MMRSLFGAFFAAAALLAPAAGRTAPTPEEIHARVAPAVVRVEARTARPTDLYYGTGSVVSPDGVVLTSTTVVPPEAKRVEVVFGDGSRAQAERILVLPEAELALVRVHPPGGAPMPFLQWGDSDAARVGDPSYTAGDFWNSIATSARVGISRGVVSGRYVLKERAPIVTLPVFLGEVIETSASMNPGTDGGPLLDGEGRLIGLMSLNVSPVRFQGVGVPSNRLRGEIARLAKRLGDEEKKSLAGLLAAFDPGGAPPPLPDPLARRTSERAKSLVRLKVPRGEPSPKPPPPPPPPLPPGLARPPSTPPELQKMLEERPDLPVAAVIWDDAGHLLTTCYNIENAAGPIQAETAPGVWEPCAVVGWSKDLDLALLSVGRDVGDPVPRAQPKGLAVGDAVAVVSTNPHEGGERHTVETGVVSAANRIFATRYQLDARTAQADSGGAVIDEEGRFVGLLAHVKPESAQGVVSGVSFLTPLHKILEVEPRLRAGEKIEATPRPFLGFGPSMEPADRGIRVGVVVPGSAAEKGGLRAGDVILAFDGVPITGFMEIYDIIQSCRVGQRVKLRILREGREMEMEFDLGKRPGGQE